MKLARRVWLVVAGATVAHAIVGAVAAPPWSTAHVLVWLGVCVVLWAAAMWSFRL